MSFVDSILKGVGGLLTGGGNAATMARIAGLSYLLNQVTKSKSSPDEPTKTNPDGIRVSFDPDTEHRVPIVYGRAYPTGVVTDARLTNGNMTMWYCITLSECTGTVMSSGQPSRFIFENIYWDDQRVRFASDGITVSGLITAEGVVNTSALVGKVRIYPFNRGSTNPVLWNGRSNGNTTPAYNLMPGWDTSYMMNDLAFILVRVDYDTTLGSTGIGRIKTQLRNTLTLPGDVLNDYLTNTRYGAGIDPAEINSL